LTLLKQKPYGHSAEAVSSTDDFDSWEDRISDEVNSKNEMK